MIGYHGILLAKSLPYDSVDFWNYLGNMLDERSKLSKIWRRRKEYRDSPESIPKGHRVTRGSLSATIDISPDQTTEIYLGNSLWTLLELATKKLTQHRTTTGNYKKLTEVTNNFDTHFRLSEKLNYSAINFCRHLSRYSKVLQALYRARI